MPGGWLPGHARPKALPAGFYTSSRGATGAELPEPTLTPSLSRRVRLALQAAPTILL